MTELDKKSLRRSIRKRRLQLNPEERLYVSHQIQKQLEHLPIYQNSQKVAFYLSHEGEVETQNLIERSWELAKNCYLPVITADFTLKFLHYFPQSLLVQNRYNILEPTYNAALEIAVEALDIVFVPLLAFDKKGNRLGSGAGYYDRTFAFLKSSQKTKTQNKSKSKSKSKIKNESEIKNENEKPSKPKLIGLAYHWQQIEALQAFEHDVPLDGIVTENATLWIP